MRRQATKLIVAAVVLLGIGVTSPPAEAREYTVDSARSELVVLVHKAGFASGLAHDHVIHAGEVHGHVALDEGHVEKSQVDLIVAASSLRADEPQLRKAHGLEGELSPSDRYKVERHMFAAGQLDVAEYPEIRFVARSVSATGSGKAQVTGEFRLHGMAHEISFPVSYEVSGDTLRARGSFRFLQSDYGIHPYSAALGAVRNQDQVELEFSVVATATSHP